MIENGILKAPTTKLAEKATTQMPAWVKNNAKWWSEDQISEGDFLSGIQYLINNGIIKI